MANGAGTSHPHLELAREEPVTERRSRRGFPSTGPPDDPRRHAGAPPGRPRCRRLVELGEQRLVEQIREQNSLWYSVGRHAGAFVVAKMPVNTTFLPYGGSCVSTWIGPLVHDPG